MDIEEDSVVEEEEIEEDTEEEEEIEEDGVLIGEDTGIVVLRYGLRDELDIPI